MAQEIAALREFPIFMWLNNYAGAPVSYIASVIFHFFGSGFIQLRSAMLLIIFPAHLLFYFIYRRLAGNQAAFAGALFLVFCPYIVMDYSTGAYGGYGESFLGLAMLILLSWRITEGVEEDSRGFHFFIMGLTSGFFVYIQFYVIPAVLVFIIPVVLKDHHARWKRVLSFSLGGIIGISPMIVYNIVNRGGSFTRAAGWAMLIGRDDISAAPSEIIRNIFVHKGAYLMDWFYNLPVNLGQYVVPGIFGSRMQAASGLFLLIASGVYVGIFFHNRNKTLSGYYHRQFAIYVLVFIGFHWLVSLYATRHFMMLFYIMPVIFFGLAERYAYLKKVTTLLLLLLAVLQAVGWYDSFKEQRFDPRPAVEGMQKEGIREFYASYWTGYPIMFLGKGALIGSPMLLTKNQPFGERRPHYTEQVVRSDDPAFVFGAEENSLEEEFLVFLKKNRISYKMVKVNEISIYNHLSRRVVVSIDKKVRRTLFSLQKAPAETLNNPNGVTDGRKIEKKT